MYSKMLKILKTSVVTLFAVPLSAFSAPSMLTFTVDHGKPGYEQNYERMLPQMNKLLTEANFATANVILKMSDSKYFALSPFTSFTDLDSKIMKYQMAMMKNGAESAMKMMQLHDSGLTQQDISFASISDRFSYHNKPLALFSPEMRYHSWHIFRGSKDKSIEMMTALSKLKKASVAEKSPLNYIVIQKQFGEGMPTAIIVKLASDEKVIKETEGELSDKMRKSWRNTLSTLKQVSHSNKEYTGQLSLKLSYFPKK